MSPKRLYRALAFAEAVTWTILIVAMILEVRRGVEWAVLVGGSIHGFVFLSYALTAVSSVSTSAGTSAASPSPCSPRSCPTRPSRSTCGSCARADLEGDWRREKTDHPADSNWVNGLLRWFLARPVLLISLAVVGIVVVFAGLLVIGPPGGREA